MWAYTRKAKAEWRWDKNLYKGSQEVSTTPLSLERKHGSQLLWKWILVLKAGISTNSGTAPDYIHIFFRSNNVNYGCILSRYGKIIPIIAHISTGNGSPGITTRWFQQQGWQTHLKTSWHPAQQLHSPQNWLNFRSVITKTSLSSGGLTTFTQYIAIYFKSD